MNERQHVAIRNPVRLYAKPRLTTDEWVLQAEGADGSRLTIIATADRLRDALMPAMYPKSHAEQVRDMYIRGEVEVEAFERALERER